MDKDGKVDIGGWDWDCWSWVWMVGEGGCGCVGEVRGKGGCRGVCRN